MINLAGKTAVVFGLANKRSIAWGIAQKLHEAGATLAICYQNERMRAEAEDLINELGNASGFQCDVSNDQEIATLFAALKEKYAKIDILVHAIAYAPAEDLKGEFINTSREGFRIAHDVSVYSLIAVSRGAVPLMTEGGSIITLTLLRRRKSGAALQRDGAGQGLAGDLPCATWRTSWGQRTSASTPFRPGPSRPWPRAAWAHWAICSSRMPSALRCTATWTRAKWAGRRFTWPAIWPAPLPAKCIYVDCGYNIMGF